MMPGLFLLFFLGVLLGQGPAASAGSPSGDLSPILARNPFNPPVALNAPPDQQPEAGQTALDKKSLSLALRATLVDGRNSLANINGTILRRGESINGYKLMGINEYEVVLEKDGQQLTLSLARRQ